MPVGWVSVAGFAAMAVGAWILAAFGAPVKVVACPLLSGRTGPKGREGAPMR